MLPGLAGDIAPQVTFAGDLSIVIGLAGDLPLEIDLGATLTGLVSLAGDLPVRIDFAASSLFSGPLWRGLSLVRAAMGRDGSLSTAGVGVVAAVPAATMGGERTSIDNVDTDRFV